MMAAERGSDVRDDLLKNVQAQIANGIAMQHAVEADRIARELEPVDFAVCLGSGRCMFPRLGADSRICPFCMRYPSHRGSDAEAEATALAKRFVAGN